MKPLKKIAICLIIALATFACVEKDCFSFSGHSLFTIENTTSQEKSLSTNPDLDSFEEDVTLNRSNYSFSLKHLSCEKVTTVNSFFPQNTFFSIWQPPKIS